jgi:maltose O-acetyltransferase
MMRLKVFVTQFVRKIRRGGVEHLIKRGLRVGRNFSFEKGVIIDKIYPHLISIGDDVIFSANVSVLAHDAGLRNIMGVVRIGHVSIGNRCFVGLGATILPNVTIGDDVIVGAGSVVSRDIPSGSVCAGVPARVICSLDDYKQRIRALHVKCPVYEPDKDPLSMPVDELIQQRDSLSHSIGLKKSLNYKMFNSLESQE